jgi:flagellar biosynthesis chaperone FliJ
MSRQAGRSWVAKSRAGVAFMLATSCSPVVAWAQQASPAQAGVTSQTLRDLEGRIGELTATLRDLRTEVACSRQESLELRQELSETREELASLKKEMEKRSGPAAPASSAQSATGAGAAPRGAPIVNSAPAAPGEKEQIDEQLANIEEEQQLLAGKVEDQYQTKVESSSKYRVRLSGIALLNVFGSRGAVDNQDVPALARDRGPLDTSGNFGATVRQSMLGLEVFGPKLDNAKVGAEVQFDFFGGFPNTPDGVSSGLVRLRTATVHLDWRRTSIVAGQDIPFFSPHSPTSLASLALPALSYAGNLWTWTPQVRIERRLVISERSGFLVQAGILDPLTGEPPYAEYYRYPQAGERSRQPAYATRLAWNYSGWGGPITFGVGGYYARQNWGFERIVDAWAGTADWSVPFSRWFSLTGEFYRGRALGGLGGGGGRSVLFDGPLTSPSTQVQGLNVAGGWSQLKFRPTEKLEFNGAFGEDVPAPRDLNYFPSSSSYFDATLGRNQSGFLNIIYRARSNLLFSAEYRRLWTYRTYETRDTADHINLSVGVLF